MVAPSYPFLVIKKEKRKRDCPTPTIQHSLLGLLVQSDGYGVFLIILPRERYCMTYYLIRMIHERIFQSTLLFVLSTMWMPFHIKGRWMLLQLKLYLNYAFILLEKGYLNNLDGKII